MTYFVALLALGFLIFVHELGHFLFAKLCKVGVVEFAIGFGKKLVSVRWGETWYSLRLIPLGGYVRMVGQEPSDPTSSSGDASDSSSLNNSHHALLDAHERELYRDPSLRFSSKNYWQKVLVVIAGPLFNVLSAILLAVGTIWVQGIPEPTQAAIIGDTVPGSPAEKAGLQKGEKILSVNGQPITVFKEFADIVRTSDGKELIVELERGEEKRAVSLHAELEDESLGRELAVQQGIEYVPSYRIGARQYLPMRPASLGESVVEGTLGVWELSRVTIRNLIGLVQGKLSRKTVSGPLSIIQYTAKAAEKSTDSVINMLIILSVSLAIFNLLPIPVLDGGHLVFFTLELLWKGQRIDRIKERATQVGVALLLLLMAFALVNDLERVLR